MPRPRLFKKPDTWEYGHDAPADEKPLAQPGKKRAATMIVYTALFFAGAAFTAFAGDRFSQVPAQDSAAMADGATTTDTTATDAASAADATAPAATPDASTAPAAPDSTAAPSADASSAAPAADSSAAPSGDSSSTTSAPADSSTATASTDANAAGPDTLKSNQSESSYSSSSSSGSGGTASPAKKTSGAAGGKHATPSTFVLLPKLKPAPKPELEGPASASTVWIDRALPDPTPPALRLSMKFARRLRGTAATSGVDWALLLGILRAKGATGHVPAGPSTLRTLANRLATMQKSAGGEWATALAYDGSPSFADKALALARYDRAVGLNALVKGLEATKAKLAQRILSDPAISIYPGGRDDIVKNKVDVRVLAVIAYLKESFGSVTVSCLISGHRLFARPGVISAHIYGRAVDIAALGGTSILGHQEPGGLTEQAVRDILLLPSEVMPKQVISLLGLGGPSFPLADHYNHIHIGF